MFHNERFEFLVGSFAHEGQISFAQRFCSWENTSSLSQTRRLWIKRRENLRANKFNKCVVLLWFLEATISIFSLEEWTELQRRGIPLLSLVSCGVERTVWPLRLWTEAYHLSEVPVRLSQINLVVWLLWKHSRLYETYNVLERCSWRFYHWQG